MVVLVSVLTTRRSDCCLLQQTEDPCSPRGNTAAREKAHADTECSEAKPQAALEEPIGEKQNIMKNPTSKADALS